MAIICDGCGSAPHSEVGAQMCAQVAAGGLAQLLRRQDRVSANNISSILETFKGYMLANISVAANSMAGVKSREKIIEEYFLFTVVGTIVTDDIVAVFTLGDGVYSINGRTSIIGPFPGNAPPYLAYGLLPGAFNESLLQFTVHEVMRTDDVCSVLIGSDGVADFISAEGQPLPGKVELLGPLSQFWTSPLFVNNPDAIRRRLALAGLETVALDQDAAARGIVRGCIKGGLLPDDTTLVVLREMRT